MLSLVKTNVVRATALCAVVLLSVSAHAKKQVLGKLGQTVTSTKIYAQPATRAKVYYSAKAFEYLIVNDSKYNEWLKVKLKNGRDGYIPRNAVAKLPYDVTQTTNGEQSVPESGLDKTSIPGYALKYVGTPYVWGGNNLKGGIDCSGFVQQLYGKIGMNLPRTASEQALVGKPITRLDDLRSGDRLYFWENKRNKIGHTGIYMGNGYFIHSSRGKNGVDTDYLSEKWRKILVAARR